MHGWPRHLQSRRAQKVTITPIVVFHLSKTVTPFSDRPCTRMPQLVSLMTVASGCWRWKTCHQFYTKMRCADLTGIWVIEPPHEGTLHRAKVRNAA